MSPTEDPEISVNVKEAISELLKRFGVFLMTPTFLYGMDKAFLSHWGQTRPRLHWGYYPFGILLIIVSIAYCVMAYVMSKRIGFPPLRRNQVIAWTQGWFTAFVIQFLIYATRFNLHRTHWLAFLGFDTLLFFTTLPVAAWFPKKYRQAPAIEESYSQP